jgi:glycine betaine/proline transport system substrate-binding protein
LVNAKQVEGYGLSDHVHIINPGDGAAGDADLYGAYERKEPWLGYQYGTSDPSVELDLVLLDEPEYSDECWFTTKACAYEPATILIAVHPDIPTKAPDVVNMLRAWDMNIERYQAVGKWRFENTDASINNTALWWLNTNVAVWSKWVTADAADAIKDALEAKEIPEGWPTQ